MLKLALLVGQTDVLAETTDVAVEMTDAVAVITVAEVKIVAVVQVLIVAVVKNMLQPKRTKFRKMQKGKMKGLATRGAELAFGSFGIKSLEPAWITSRQIEAARIAVTRFMKREGQVWIRIFPDKPVTKKPAEVRMGKGKGAPEYWVAVVRPGRMIFEAEGVPLEVAKEALRLAAQKLPVQTKFVLRRDYVEA